MAEAQAGSNRNKKKAFMIVGAVVAVGLIVGFFYDNYLKTHISTDDAFIEGNIHTIAARVNGTVKNVPVGDNQRVKKGDVLVELDPADYETRVAAAQATLDLQRAAQHLAESELKRARTLFQREANSADRLDKAVSASESANAQVKLAEAHLRQAQLDLGYTTIVAPSDGYVTRKSVQEGNRVQAGQPLMALVELDNLWVVANFKETQMTNIRPGQGVDIDIDAFPGRVYRGTVDSIMAGTGVSFSLFPAENATGNYVKVVQRIPVKITFERGANDAHRFRVGMSVVPTVIAR
jgi:membrane fusion protein, multidrug efflux system